MVISHSHLPGSRSHNVMAQGHIARPARRDPGLTTRLLVGLLVLPALAGCGGGSSSGGGDESAPTASPPPGPAPVQPWLGGQYFGTATDTDGEHNVSALLLGNGDLRVAIGEPWEATGSSQFIGHIQTDEDQALGDGLIVGEGCGGTRPSRFCGVAVPAVVDLTELTYDGRPALSGSVTVTVNGTTESWSLELPRSIPIYSGYLHPLQDVANVYSDYYVDYVYPDEESALFGNDPTFTVDDAGRVFFQSPETGCIGNGRLDPYGDGKSAIFTVTLLVESCTGGRAYLNGGFEGLANNLGGDDAFGKYVVLYLSRTAEMDAPAAATMWWLTYH